MCLHVCIRTHTHQSAVASSTYSVLKCSHICSENNLKFLRWQFSNFLARFWYLFFTLHTIRCEFQKSHLKKTQILLTWMLQKPSFSAVLAFNNWYLLTGSTQLICYGLSSWSPILQLLFSHVFPLNFDLVQVLFSPKFGVNMPYNSSSPSMV